MWSLTTFETLEFSKIPIISSTPAIQYTFYNFMSRNNADTGFKQVHQLQRRNGLPEYFPQSRPLPLLLD